MKAPDSQFQRCFCILQVTFAEVSLASAALEFWQQETGCACVTFVRNGREFFKTVEVEDLKGLIFQT